MKLVQNTNEVSTNQVEIDMTALTKVIIYSYYNVRGVHEQVCLHCL